MVSNFNLKLLGTSGQVSSALLYSPYGHLHCPLSKFNFSSQERHSGIELSGVGRAHVLQLSGQSTHFLSLEYFPSGHTPKHVPPSINSSGGHTHFPFSGYNPGAQERQ